MSILLIKIIDCRNDWTPPMPHLLGWITQNWNHGTISQECIYHPWITNILPHITHHADGLAELASPFPQLSVTLLESDCCRQFFYPWAQPLEFLLKFPRSNTVSDPWTVCCYTSLDTLVCITLKSVLSRARDISTRLERSPSYHLPRGEQSWLMRYPCPIAGWGRVDKNRVLDTARYLVR